MIENLYFAGNKIKLSIVLFALSGAFLHAQQWENVGGVENVSLGGSSFNNLVIDNVGNYYLSYYDSSVTKGSVQKFDGTTWSYLGGSPGITNGFATYNSLSINPSASAVYYTNQGEGLEVRQFDGVSWTQLPSPTTSTVNYQASAVSPANVLFMYASHDSGTVQRYINGAWEQVGNAGFSNGASFAEMVIGTNNKIYTCNVSSGVRVYENSTNASSTDNWELVGGDIVDLASSGEQYNSDIAIDSNNNLYVAYVSNSANNRKVNVKKFNGVAWEQMGSAYFSSGRVQHVSIAVTPMGDPYVVTSRWENDDFLKNTVYKLNKTTQSWETLGGDFISDGEATYNDIAVDSVNGYLVLAYSQNGTRVKRTPITTNSTSGCNNTDPGSNPGDLGCVTFNYDGQSVNYTTVRGQDGNVWLQQNLGSTNVATALNDIDSYGDLFQWGRSADGHQKRNSATISAPSPNNPKGLTGISSYIIGSPEWWSGNSLTDEWSAGTTDEVSVSRGIDPCKAVGTEWRLPTQSEWTTLVNAEGISNPATAFNSKLKLPAGGNRSYTSGSFSFVGQRGSFWSSTPTGVGGKYLYIGSTIANAGAGASRGQGASVRCIKDFSTLGISDVQLNVSEIGIYPNPTKDILYIKTDSVIENVSITNFAGQKMNTQVSNNQINMNGLPKGIYILELKLKTGQTSFKKVVKN